AGRKAGRPDLLSRNAEEAGQRIALLVARQRAADQPVADPLGRQSGRAGEYDPAADAQGAHSPVEPEIEPVHRVTAVSQQAGTLAVAGWLQSRAGEFG